MSLPDGAVPTKPVPDRWRSNVALFLGGQTASLFGSMIVQYGVMWYVTLETGSGVALALYALVFGFSLLGKLN